MRDFYAGIGTRQVPVFRTERQLPTDWEAAMRFIDSHWSPTPFDAAPLLDAFPARFGRLDPTPRADGLDALLGW
jgi:hypothetical protein